MNLTPSVYIVISRMHIEGGMASQRCDFSMSAPCMPPVLEISGGLNGPRA